MNGKVNLPLLKLEWLKSENQIHNERVIFVYLRPERDYG